MLRVEYEMIEYPGKPVVHTFKGKGHKEKAAEHIAIIVRKKNLSYLTVT